MPSNVPPPHLPPRVAARPGRLGLERGTRCRSLAAEKHLHHFELPADGRKFSIAQISENLPGALQAEKARCCPSG